MEDENTPQALDADSPEFDAAIRSGRYDAEDASQDESGDVGGPSPLLAALDEFDGKQPAAEQPQPSVAPEGEKPQEQAQPVEDWQRKYNSVAGNNRQLQQLYAQERQRAAQMEQRIAQVEQKAQEDRDLAQIRQSVPAELQDEAVADYQRRKQAGEHEQGLEAYRGYLQEQQQQIAQVQFGLFQQSLPHEMADFVGFVAERAEAPAEPLLEIVQTDAFRDLYSMVRSQADLDHIGQVLLAVGQVEAKKDRARKESNRTQAVQEGTHRDVNLGGGGSGSTGQDLEARINGMTDAQFNKFAENVRRAGGMRGV